MKRVFKYGFFRGLDPVCQERIRQYPELAQVADAVRAGLQARREDVGDLQHQWVYPGSTRVMQSCFEAGCDAVRPIPLHGYGEASQVLILRTYMNHKGL